MGSENFEMQNKCAAERMMVHAICLLYWRLFYQDKNLVTGILIELGGLKENI